MYISFCLVTKNSTRVKRKNVADEERL